MLIGYASVSKANGSQSLDLQRDALQAAGVVLVVWKLDRLGRTLAHLVNTVQDLSARGVGLRVLTGQGAQIDTTTAAGRLVFVIWLFQKPDHWAWTAPSRVLFANRELCSCKPRPNNSYLQGLIVRK